METQQAGSISFVAAPNPLAKDRYTLVCLHGAGLSKKLWDEQVAGLADIVNVIAVDLPGHGDAPGECYDQVADYAGQVLAFIDQMDLPRPIPCGLSMGGAIAQYLLINHPERFPAGILMATGARLRVLPLIFEALQGEREAFIDMLMGATVSPKNNNERMRGLVSAVTAVPPSVAEKDFKACDTFDVMDQLDRINVPVLVIGGADDMTTPPKYTAFLADRIKQAELVNIESAGHLAPMEQPAAVNQAIAAFLRKLPGR